MRGLCSSFSSPIRSYSLEFIGVLLPPPQIPPNNLRSLYFLLDIYFLDIYLLFRKVMFYLLFGGWLVLLGLSCHVGA